MRRFNSTVKTSEPSFIENLLFNEALANELQARQNAARFTRPQRDITRLEKQGKLTPRTRLEHLLDPGTPFLELSTLAACEADYASDAPGAGQIVGIGVVSGKEVLIRADDSTVKGGAWYPLSVKKIVRALEIAINNRLPVIHMCDSAGGFLPLQHDFFADRYGAGRMFRNQCTLSKMGVPQIALVLGHCTAGGAYIPALSDYSVIVEGTGAIFLGGPPLVKAATGEDVTVDELGGARMHTSHSGVADTYASSELEGIALVREMVEQWREPEKHGQAPKPAEEPAYDPRELYGLLPKDGRVQFDMQEIIARIVDGSRFQAYQPDFGKTLVCGFARVHGHQVGILANNGVLFSDSALKGAHFIQLCDQNRTPLIFLQNITGFMVGKEYERGGISKDGAKMIMAVSGASVPKITINCGGSYGAGTYGMNGRAFDPRFMFSWPRSQVGVMGAEQAADVLTTIKTNQLRRQGEELSDQEIDNIRKPVLEGFAKTSSAWYATSEIWDDGIIDPLDTRNAIAMSISAALNVPIDEPHYGVFRM